MAKYCPYCGSPVKRESKFCTQCGEILQTEQDNKDQALRSQHMSISEEAENILESIFNTQANYTFLVGAGISMESPSSLPSALKIVRNIIELCAPKEEIENIYSLESLRYEMLIDQIKRYFDQKLTFMSYFDLVTEPNVIHLFLAHAIMENHYVVTTNFDHLIEYGLMRLLSQKYHTRIIPVITRDDFRECRDPKEFINKGKYAVYKIHGSNKNIITNESTMKSLKTTMSQLGQQRKRDKTFGIEYHKKPALDNLTKKRNLIVMGYSGSDDFDIGPFLKELNDLKSLIWIEHVQNDNLEILKVENTEGSKENKLESMLNEFVAKGQFDVYCVKANTAAFVFEVLKPKLLNLKSDISPHVSEIKTPEFDQWIANTSAYSAIKEYIKWAFAFKIFYLFGDLEAYERCVKRGYELVKKTKDENCIASFLHNLGLISQRKGEVKKAQKYLDESLKIYNKTEDYAGLSTYYCNLGTQLYKEGKLDEAIETYKKALPLIDKLADKGEIGNAFTITNNLGIISSTKGNFKEAIDYYKKGLLIIEITGNLRDKAVVNTNLGEAYRKLGKIDKAIKMINEAIQIKEALGEEKGLSLILYNLGTTYTNKGDYQMALKYFTEALKVAENQNEDEMIVASLGNIGWSYREMKKYGKSLDSLKESLEYAKQKGLEQKIREQTARLGDLHHTKAEGGIDIEENLEIAVDYYNKTLKLAEESNDNFFIAYINRCLGNISRIRKDFNGEFERLFKALDIAEKSKLTEQLKYEKSVVLNDIGMMYYRKKEYENAIKYLEESLEITKDLKSKMTRLFSLSSAYKGMNNRLKSLELITESADIAEKLGDPESKYAYNVNMAITLIRLDREDEAQKLLENIQHKIKDENIVALCNIYLGMIYKLLRKNVKEGIPLIQKALLYYEKTNNQEMIKQARNLLK